MMSWSLTIRDFVRAHKYKTEAEKFGWSFVFQDFVSVELKSKVTETIKVSIFLSLYDILLATDEFCLTFWFPQQSAPWWLPIERVFWRQVRSNIVVGKKKAPNPRADCKPWCGSSHSSPQDQGLASKSVWTSRWSKWAGTTRWPSAAGGTDGCPRRRSGSGLPAGGCRVRGLARRDLPTALGRSRYRLGLGMV